jgi:uncharacterized protein
MSLDAEYKKKIIGLILVFLPKTKIYLFGSRATKTHRETSDVDIALDNKEKVSRITISQIKDAIMAIDMPYDIDIVDLNNVSDKFKTLIKKTMVQWQ